jgi:hypothetical protein
VSLPRLTSFVALLVAYGLPPRKEKKHNSHESVRDRLAALSGRGMILVKAKKVVCLGVCSWINYVASAQGQTTAASNVVLFSNSAQMEQDVRSVLFAMQRSSTNSRPSTTNQAIQEWVRYLGGPVSIEMPLNWITNDARLSAPPQVELLSRGYWNLLRNARRAVAMVKNVVGVKMLSFDHTQPGSSEYVQLASAQVNRACAEYACEPHPTAEETANAFERFIREVLLPSVLSFGEELEHQAEVEAGKIAGSYVEQMLGLQNMVVAVGRLDEAKRFTFSGSGFLVEDRLYTCAHVLAGYFVDHATLSVAKQAKIAVIFRSKGGYPETEAVEVEIRREHVFPERDVAVVPLLGLAKEKALDIHSKLYDFYTTEDPDNAMGAYVFIWGVENTSGLPKPVWLKPEPIYFPPVITKSMSSRADPLLGCAFRHHLEGLLWGAGGLPSLLMGYGTNSDNLISRALPAFTHPELSRCGYTECNPPRILDGVLIGESCSLVYIPRHADLLAMATNSVFTARPRIHCFGTGLQGIGGMSGSPVFRLANGRHRLVGVYAGISEPNASAIARPTLDCFGKAIPFVDIKTLIKK